MSYARILDRCLNTPLNIESGKLETLTSEVFLKLIVNESALVRSEKTPSTENRPGLQAPSNTLVIPITGSLVNKNGAGSSGVTSYAGIRNQIANVIANNASTESTTKITNIVFDISSGGGESAGNFPLTDLIFSLPTKYGIHTYGYTDSVAASAAFAVFCSCEKTYAVDTATLGSIGTIMSLVDLTASDANQGVKYEILRSKSDKAAYNPHEEITDKVRAEAQTLLKVWDDKFNSIVLKYQPNITMDTITKLNGKTVTAQEGVAMHLVQNIVSSIDDVLNELHAEAAKTQQQNAVKQPQFPLTNIGNTTMILEEAMAQVIALTNEVNSLKASSKIDLQSAVAQERNRSLKVIEAGNTLNIPQARIVSAISKGWELDTVSEVFTEIAAAQSETTAIVTVGVPTDANGNVLNPASGNGSVSSISLSAIQKLGANQQQSAESTLAGGALSLDNILDAMQDIGGKILQQQGAR